MFKVLLHFGIVGVEGFQPSGGRPLLQELMTSLCLESR